MTVEKTRVQQLGELLMWATIMSRDATTTNASEYGRALAVRAFWNEVAHQVANALVGSAIEFEELLRVCDDMAAREKIANWAHVRSKVAPKV